MGVTIPLFVGVMAGVEAVLLLLISFPAGKSVRTALTNLMLSIIQPLLFSIPLAVVLLLDVYQKFNSIKDCRGETCTAAERDRYRKAEYKNERNFILCVAVIFLYWLLWRMTMLQSYILHLENKTTKAAAAKNTPPSVTKKVD